MVERVPGPPPASPLARIALAVYGVLAAYASLYPLQGWQDHGLSPFAWLAAPWPRYFTAFDVTVNVLAYAPLGLFAVAALAPRMRGLPAVVTATLGGIALSALLEGAQSYLPARIASNLDLLCNAVGAALGAWTAVALASWMQDGPLRRARAGAFLPGAAVDFGLVVVGLWIFVQLNPAMLLFGTGDLHELLLPADGRARPPEYFVLVESLTAAANLVAVGLLFSTLVAPGRPARAMLCGLLAVALGVKTAAFAIVLRAESVLAWLTPGAQLGLLCGGAVALVALALPRTARLALAAVLLMAGTVLVNLAPPNPYLSATLKVWQQGHFLNFNGLTRLVSIAWPFIALGYLIFLAARRGREAAR